MKRVAIIGCPGAGKSTAALRLAQLSGLPLLHLDAAYHDASRWSVDREEKRRQWQAYHESLLECDTWIIDGNYKSTLSLRVAAADTILFLDYPRWLCLAQALLRSLRWYVGQKQIACGNPGKVDREFLRFIWSYRKDERPWVLEVLAQHEQEKRIRIFTDPRQVELFLQAIKEAT